MATSIGAPGSTRRPARNSRARITRRPSGCSSRMPQHAAVAGDDGESPSAPAWTMRARRGWSDASSVSPVRCSRTRVPPSRAADQRPRLQAANAVVDGGGRQRPVDRAFRLRQLGRVGHPLVGCGVSVTCPPPARRPSRAAASRRAPRGRARPPRSSRRRRSDAAPIANIGTGVERLDDAHDRDAGLGDRRR